MTRSTSRPKCRTSRLRAVTALPAALIVALAARASAAQSLDPAPYLAALPESAVGTAAARLRDVRAVTVDADGVPPLEIALAGSLTEARDDSPRTDVALWLLRPAGGSYTVLAARRWPLAAAEAGTWEATPGLAALNAHASAQGGAQWIELEFVEAQGGSDPRFLRETLAIVRYDAGALENVFTCATRDLTATGPSRAGSTTTRSVRFEGREARVRSVAERDDSPGQTRVQSGRYRWNGRTYVAVGRDVCRENRAPGEWGRF